MVLVLVLVSDLDSSESDSVVEVVSLDSEVSSELLVYFVDVVF